ncbi:MAG: IS3 family transposase [Nitrosomonas sp.]|nr:IS3 family transposase [Nitrosomonas sp.]
MRLLAVGTSYRAEFFKPLTRLQAKEKITEYIEIFYNRQRKQERLSSLSPEEFK